MSFQNSWYFPSTSIEYPVDTQMQWRAPNPFNLQPEDFHKEHNQRYYSTTNLGNWGKRSAYKNSEARPYHKDTTLPRSIKVFLHPKDQHRKFSHGHNGSISYTKKPIDSMSNTFSVKEEEESEHMNAGKVHGKTRCSNPMKGRHSVKIIVATQERIKEVVITKERPKVFAEELCSSSKIEDKELEKAIEYYIKKSIAKKVKHTNYTYYPALAESLSKP